MDVEYQSRVFVAHLAPTKLNRRRNAHGEVTGQLKKYFIRETASTNPHDGTVTYCWEAKE